MNLKTRCLLLVLLSLVEPLSADRPNIVMVVADDLSKRCIGCYGNPDVRTPNIDQLAAQGIRFTSAFTSTAMCAPTRAQLYTGMFPVRNGAYPNHSQIKRDVITLPTYLSQLGYRVGLNGKRHFGPPKSFPFQNVGGGRFNAQAIRNFVFQDEPFCLVVASHSPHVPWKAGDASIYNPSRLSLPEDYVDTQPMRAAMARYYGEVTDLDRETGDCMKIVRESGKYENTIFIFTSEQGAQFPGGKWTCYEEGLNVGLIIRWPQKIKPRVSDAWVHYVDMVPTLVELAGGTPDRNWDGISFAKVLTGEIDTHRSVTYGVHTQKGAIGSPPTGYPIRSIRISNYKYIWNLNANVTFNSALTQNDKENYWQSWIEKAKTDAHAKTLVRRYLNRPPEEFYDLTKDPLELENLALRSEHRQRMNAMKIKLEVWMAMQGDQGIVTEMDFHQAKRR